MLTCRPHEGILLRNRWNKLNFKWSLGTVKRRSSSLHFSHARGVCIRGPMPLFGGKDRWNSYDNIIFVNIIFSKLLVALLSVHNWNIVLFRSHKLLWLDIRFWAHVTSMETKQFTVFRNRASRGRRRMGCKGARALQFWQFSHGYLTWRFLWNFFRGVDNFRVFFLSGKFIQWWRPCSACHCVVISSSKYVSTINLSFTLEKIG